MSDVELYLPYPPTVNNYYVKTQRNVMISQKGRLFRDKVAAAVAEQCGSGFSLAQAGVSAPYSARYIFFPPDKRKRDLDNLLKPLLDALTQCGFWDDDSLINQIHVYRGKTHSPGGACYAAFDSAGPLLPFDTGFDYSAII